MDDVEIAVGGTEYEDFPPGSLAKMFSLGSHLRDVEVLVRPGEIVDVLKVLEDNTHVRGVVLNCVEEHVRSFFPTTQPLAGIRSAVWNLSFVNKTLDTMEILETSFLSRDRRRLFGFNRPAMGEWLSMARIIHYSKNLLIATVIKRHFYHIFTCFLNPCAKRGPRPTHWVPCTSWPASAVFSKVERPQLSSTTIGEEMAFPCRSR